MYGSLCAEFYDLDKRFASQTEVSFYKQLLNPEALVLEPMCGSGRLLIPLLKAGIKVHGLDNSAAMLKNCRERAKIHEIEPQLFQGAVESIVLPHRYQTILIPFGSFQLLFPREAAIKTLINMHRHLNPGGKLILDLFIPYEARYESNREESTLKKIKTAQGEVIQHKSHNTINVQERVIFCDSIYIKSKNGKILQEEKEQMHISWYRRYAMELLLERCGFRAIQYQEVQFRRVEHQIYVGER